MTNIIQQEDQNHRTPQNENNPVFEIEQKFALLEPTCTTGDKDSLSLLRTIQDRLKSEFRMIPNNNDEGTLIVDWYVDTNPNPILILHDYWLRYRQVFSNQKVKKNMGNLATPQKASWQLKRGRNPTGSSTATTIYDELEGLPAIQACLDLIHSKDNISSNSTGASIPFSDMEGLPAEASLQLNDKRFVPFAKIETQRLSWIPSHTKKDDFSLCVDLDIVAHLGYMVGEVETCVDRLQDIPAGQAKVQDFISKLQSSVSSSNNDNTPSKPAMGKLEYYLQTYRPELYEMCVQSGTIKPQ